MSLTLTLSGKSTILAANYFPSIDLSDGDYDLAIFQTYHTISNVNESNNKFYLAKEDAEITIPEGSYEVRDINEFLKRVILRKRSYHVLETMTVDVVMVPITTTTITTTITSMMIMVKVENTWLRSAQITIRWDARLECIQNKLWQGQQHWIARILVEVYAVAKMARIGQLSINIMNVNIIRVEWPWARTATAKARIRHTNFHRTCRQDIRYQRGRRRSFTCRSSHGALRI